MKYFLLFSLLITNALNAQTWLPINASDTLLYQKNSRIASLWVDSVSTTSGVTTYYFNQIAEYKQWYAGSDSFYILTKQSNFLAKKMVILADGSYQFYGKDTFKLVAQSPVGSSWAFNTGGVTATITNADTATVDGVIVDSIKTITTSDGRSIILSKQNGILKYKNSYEPSEYNRVGNHTNGSGHQLYMPIDKFKFEKGDVYYQFYSIGDCLTFGSSYSFNESNIIVIDSTSVTSDSSILYLTVYNSSRDNCNNTYSGHHLGYNQVQVIYPKELDILNSHYGQLKKIIYSKQVLNTFNYYGQLREPVYTIADYHNINVTEPYFSYGSQDQSIHHFNTFRCSNSLNNSDTLHGVIEGSYTTFKINSTDAINFNFGGTFEGDNYGSLQLISNKDSALTAAIIAAYLDEIGIAEMQKNVIPTVFSIQNNALHYDKNAWQVSQFSMYNAMGQQVQMQLNEKTNALNVGVYFVKCYVNDKPYSQKIIIH